MSIFKNNFVVGVTAALAATVIAPMLIPAIKRSGRPLAKSLVKGGIVLYEKGREAVAGAGEMMEDVVAEVRAEATAKQAATAEVDAPAAYVIRPEFQQQVDSGNGAGSSAGNGASTSQFQQGGPT